MTEPAAYADLEKRLAALGKDRVGVDPRDIVEVVGSVMASVNGDRSSVNVKLYADIEALANYIRTAKAEITAIRADEINTRFIPAATDELSAIVGATEHATNAIFEAVESIEALAEGMAPESAETITDAVTRVYEACSFQDITGQRISKIVKVLQNVEAKVQALIEAFGEQSGVPDRKAADEPAADPAPASGNDLMSGPQLPENAISQDDVDALLASFD
ncbi:MAG: protein phosphatase CheZ [Kiloniellaceae bacterium]